jgi:uncharacterized protein (TIGR03435 family)
MTNSLLLGLTFLLAGAALAQSQGVTRPAFEVATIKQSAPLSDDSDRSREIDVFMRLANGGVKADPAQVQFTFKTLEELICFAYRVKSFQISAPEGLSDTRYDITAKMPEGVSAELVPEMLQSLLKDRFKLTSHLANKEFDVYVLLVGEDGLKIPQKPADYRFARTNTASPQTMQSLATSLTLAAGKPVLERTALQGDYMVPQDFRSLMNKGAIGHIPQGIIDPADVPSPAMIRRAIQDLGLRLEPRRESLPLLVIDHVDPMPSKN